MSAALNRLLHASSTVVRRARRTTVLLASTLVVSACNRGITAPTGVPAPTPVDPRRAEAFLDTLEQRTFQWFWDTTDPRTGLTPDRWPSRTFSSVAAIGFALTAYPIGAERSYVSRQAAAERTLSTLRFLYQLPQGDAPTGVAGYRGFFYHFLDFEKGYRFEKVELSTIDTSLLMAGVLFCQSYFADTVQVERAVRAYADSLYRRVEWTWPRNRAPAINMGWKPEEQFLPFDWRGYDEAMIVYVLALGSPTYAVEPAAWEEWTRPYQWREFYGQQHVNFAPLFGHQYSHVWIDFRGIRDAYMRGKGIDYFENSRRATLAQRAYAIDNPYQWDTFHGQEFIQFAPLFGHQYSHVWIDFRGIRDRGGVDWFENSRRAALAQHAYAIDNPGRFRDYGDRIWGLSACDGPMDATVTIDGRPREFHSYTARGATENDVRDDGTIAPTAAASSIAFAPEIAIPAIREMTTRYGENL